MGRPVGGDAHSRGDAFLELEQQSVFAPVGGEVQANSQVGEQRVVGGKRSCLRLAEQTSARQVARAVAVFIGGWAGPLRLAGAVDPEQSLDVAQATGAFLEIGLQQQGYVGMAAVAGLLLQRLGLVEIGRIHLRRQPSAQALKQRRIAGKVAGFQQIGLDGDIPR